jgi:hypothetical protein
MSRERSTVELRSAVIKGVKVGDYEIEITSSQTNGGWTVTAILPDGRKVISGPASTQEAARHDVFLQAQSQLYPQVKVEFTKRFEDMNIEEKKLTTAARKRIPKGDFAIPRKAPESGSYPIEDKNHARNALARVSQFGSSAEKARVRAAVHRKYPGISSKDEAVMMHRADQLLEVVGREWVPPHQNVDADTEMEMAAKSPFTAWEYAQRTNKHHPTLLKAVFNSPYEKFYKRHFNMPQFDPFYESKWLKGAINQKHKGFCSPMSKKTCTPARKALARRFKSGDLSQNEAMVQQQADRLLEAPDVYDIGDEGELLDNPECPQCGGPGVPLGSLGSLLHFRCRNCGWNFSQPQEPMTPPPMAEANFLSPEEKQALDNPKPKAPPPKRHPLMRCPDCGKLGDACKCGSEPMPIRFDGHYERMPRKKAAFYPSDGGSGGGGGGFTSV